MVWKLLLIPLFIYLAIMLLVFAIQGKMIFPTSLVGGADLLPRGERLTLETPGGERLQGVHFPPAAGPGGGGTVIIGFGGNAWNAELAAAYLHDIYPNDDVIAFHYRGYAPSSGRPSAAALIEDAPLVYDAAVAKVKPERTIAVGFSLGSGIAASLAGRRELFGLILVTPFDSLMAVAAGHYRWLPVRIMFRHEVPAARWLREAPVPTAIIAAEEDTLILPARTEALRRQVPRLVLDRTIEGVGHNDIYHDSAFHAAMREAVEAFENVRQE